MEMYTRGSFWTIYRSLRRGTENAIMGATAGAGAAAIGLDGTQN
jgi:hypothetical protein